MSSPAETPNNTARGALGALVRIGIAAAVLVGAYVLYSKYVESSKVLKERTKSAFDLVIRDGVKEYREAAAKLDEALSIRPNDPYAVSARAEVSAILWVEHGIAEEAENARKYVALAASEGFNLAERFSAEGLAKIGEGQLAEAETTLTKLAADAGHARIIGALGLVHTRLGKLTVAKQDFKQASDRDWRSPRFSNAYGEVSFDGGDFITAQGAFQKALEQVPGHPRAVIGKARADVGRGERVAEAIEAIDGVLARPADELSPVLKERALTGKAEALLASGEFEKAAAAADEALAVKAQVDPGISYAHFVKGMALAKQKQDGAIESFKAAIEKTPWISRLWFDAALALAEAGKPADGEALLDEYLKGREESDVYLLARGDFFVQTQAYDKALAAYDKAIAQNEVNPDGFYKKGALLALQSRLPKANRKALVEEALKQFEKTVSIRERYADVYRQVGLIYMDTNPKSGEALEQFAKALKYYKEQKVPKATIDAFIAEVEQRYLKANLKGNAKQWVEEATAMAR